MTTIRAIYDGGVFRPTQPVDLPAGAQVDLTLSSPQGDPVALMKARFPDSFGCMPAEDADEIMRLIDAEFGRVNPDDWR